MEPTPYNIFIQHIKLITTDFTKSNHSWDKGSVIAGMSGIFYVLPYFFIKDTNNYTTIFKVLWIIQAIFVCTSDYFLANRKSTIIRGIDRLLATLMVISMMIITYKYYNIWYMLIGAFFPLYFVYQSKMSGFNDDWESYVFNHAMWHITGPIIASFILYQIQLKHKLFVYQMNIQPSLR